ncbi:uncharacterized protein LOC134848141 isoform X3 [Symsagittifera roscoffensis]|uniref:uncharacterized protein LOC134848141 isoform X3 n=1 Tax=Symsagittifera roscoffensis TaxID=84072 RepID=UPI00307BA799
MGKKKSGKAKSGKGKKGKKGDDEQMSMRESILAYQINVKEQALEDLNYEAESLQKKIEKGKERNMKLREEQLGHLNSVVREVRGEEEGDKRDAIAGRAAIEEALHDLWLTDQNESQEVAAVKKHIEELEAEIAEEMTVFDKWNDYKDYGQYEDEHRIAILEDEIRDNQATFEEQSKFHQEDLAKNKRAVGSYTDKTVENVKDGAASKAMAKMDKKERREITDHSWLKQEAVRYKQEVERLEEEVNSLEQGNLALMAKLFDCRLEDLNISSNLDWITSRPFSSIEKMKFFLTQFDTDTVFANNAIEEKMGIIERDLITHHPLLRPSPFAPQLANQKLPPESQVMGHSEISYGSLALTNKPQVQRETMLVEKGDGSVEDDRTSGYSSMAPSHSLPDTVSSSGAVGAGRGVGGRPTHQYNGRQKSATLKAIEERVFGVIGEEDDDDLEMYIEDDDEGIDLDDTRSDIDEDLGLNAGEGLANNLVDNHLNLEDDSKDDYLKLGPLELKMLQIVGTQIPIRAPTPPTQEELELQVYNPDDWPVTHKMLNTIQDESFLSMKNTMSQNSIGKSTAMLERENVMSTTNVLTSSTASKAQMQDTTMMSEASNRPSFANAESNSRSRQKIESTNG